MGAPKKPNAGGSQAYRPRDFRYNGGSLLPDRRDSVLAAGATRGESRPDGGFARRVTALSLRLHQRAATNRRAI